jgi:hypothetical protein
MFHHREHGEHRDGKKRGSDPDSFSSGPDSVSSVLSVVFSGFREKTNPFGALDFAAKAERR